MHARFTYLGTGQQYALDVNRDGIEQVRLTLQPNVPVTVDDIDPYQLGTDPELRSAVNAGQLRVDIVGQVGDVAGSSSQGMSQYADSGTVVNVPEETWTAIPNDGSASLLGDTYAPPGSTTFLLAGGSYDFSSLGVGDTVIYRYDFFITPQVNQSLATFRFLVGEPGSQFALQRSIGVLNNGAGIEYRIQFTDLLFIEGDATRENPVIPQILLSRAGTLRSAGVVFDIQRR
jgi:hypothetical protein